MKRQHLMARLLRALSGKTQQQFGKATGIHPTLIAQLERGQSLPSPAHLTRMARAASLTVADAGEILRLAEALRGADRLGRENEDLDELEEKLRAHISRSRQRLLTLPLPENSPKAEDRLGAEELWQRLKELAAGPRLAVVQVAEEFQSWALCERVCEESARAASRKIEEAAALVRLAQEIADRVRGPEAWRRRLQAYALAHEANALRVAGELKGAEIVFEQARRLWHSSADPAGVLDPGRLLELEASLRRAQRRFDEALALLDEAMVVGRRPERALINKGFTLEVMGEYERAVETLLQAEPLVDRQGDPRLRYNQRFNLAVNYCHLGRCAEAAELAAQVRKLAADLGDEIFLIRVTWLEGRIAAGLDRPGEALRLLEEARRRFAAEKMAYDAALASLEKAVLLLDESRTAEVKALAQELPKAFDSWGVHLEALAALKLFQEAAEREEATAGLARRVLRYLFRARNDQGLRFFPSPGKEHRW